MPTQSFDGPRKGNVPTATPEPATPPDADVSRETPALPDRNPAAENSKAEYLRARGWTVTAPGTTPAPPSFGMSEGTAQEIEATGKAVDPWTGKPLTTADLPPGRPKLERLRDDEKPRPE